LGLVTSGSIAVGDLPIVTPAKGGTGVANGTNNTITFTGNYTLGITLSNNTAVTFPTSGTLVNDAVTTLSSLASIGTITTGTWHGGLITGTYGGTGVNNGASTITIGGNVTFSGAHTFTGTLSNDTSVTFPTTGTLSTLAGTETLTNKTLSEPILSKVFTVGTATTIAAGNAIYVGSDGKAYLAQANSTTTMPCIYVAITGNTAGNPVTCMSLGYITTGSWTAGGYIYVSDSVAGGLTQTLPNVSGDIIMIVGIAVSSSEIAWQPIVTLQLQ
jgi:hypothetical protein